MKTCLSSSLCRLPLLLALLAVSSVAQAGKVAVWGDNSYNQRLLPADLGNVKAVAAGYYHSLALRADGTVAAWGRNDYGLISPPPGLSNVVAIAAGSLQNLALLANGRVVAWGTHPYAATNVPADLANVRAIASGPFHGLALKTDGTVSAWGVAPYGSLAINVPAGLANVIAIAAGDYHNLALRADGTVLAWGDNSGGATNVPTGLSGIVSIAAGPGCSFAVTVDGRVLAWGSGFNPPTNSVPWLSNVVSVSSGGFETFALKTDGTVGIVGPNVPSPLDLPPGLANVAGLSVGALHGVALVPDGPPEILAEPGPIMVDYQSNIVLSVTAAGHEPLAYQWFFDGSPVADSPRFSGITNSALLISNAQFSDMGTYTLRVSNPLGIVQSAGAFLTVKSPPVITQQPGSQGGRAGTNVFLMAGAFGTPPLAYQWLHDGDPVPGATQVSLMLSNAQASQSGTYTLRVTNLYGITQSSNAVVTITDSPPYILTQPASRSAPIGGTTTLSVTARGSVPLAFQWKFNGVDIPGATEATLTLIELKSTNAGYYDVEITNSIGQIVSAKAQLTLVPVMVWGSVLFAPTNVPAGLSNLVAISAGDYHLLALKADGTCAAWAAVPSGLPWMPSGRGTPTNVPAGLSNVVAISAAPTYNLALLADGTVRAWGYTNPAVRGGDYSSTNLPAGLSNVVAISAAYYHALALKADGHVVSWRTYNALPYSADPPYAASLTNIPWNLSNVVAIAAASDHNLAVKRDGTITCWGNPNATYVPPWLSNVISVAAAQGYSLALLSNGKVTTWSSIGLSYPYLPSKLPIATNVPPGLSNVVAIAAGSEALALRSDGKVFYWNGITNGVRSDLANVFAIAAGGFSATLADDGLPHFVIEPFVQTTVNSGTTVRLHARAAGVQPLAYHWVRNGVPVAGATEGTLVLTNVQGRQAGVYVAFASNALGQVRSRQAVVTVPFSTNLAVALNATNLVWNTMASNNAWFAQNLETHDGNAAAQSGPVGHNAQSSLQTTVTGPGTLSFWWKVSSEEYYDRLSFSLDVLSSTRSISGETDWQQVVMPIPSGAHVVRWFYIKDATVSAGADAGWVDQVLFTPALPLAISNLHLLNDGTIVFSSADPSGRVLAAEDLALIEVQTSSNLVEWTRLPGVCSLSNGCVVIRDETTEGAPRKFYRLLQR